MWFVTFAGCWIYESDYLHTYCEYIGKTWVLLFMVFDNRNMALPYHCNNHKLSDF